MDAAARRKNATRETTNTLKAWLYEHRKNPYPTKGEKIMLAIITKMTLTQVGSCWLALYNISPHVSACPDVWTSLVDVLAYLMVVILSTATWSCLRETPTIGFIILLRWLIIYWGWIVLELKLTHGVSVTQKRRNIRLWRVFSASHTQSS